MQTAAGKAALKEGDRGMQQTRIRPLVSVIMPAHNAEDTIAAAIRSVQAQTVRDWELLVLDDCSADDTFAAAQRLAEEDARICPLKNGENLGAAKTRSRGLEIARGEWIAFLDSDDLWRPAKLEKQLALADQTGAKLLYTSYCLFSEETGLRRDYLVPARTDYASMLRENVIGCSTAMVRRSALEGRRFPEGVYHEDYALWLSLLRGGCTAAGCTEVLADWRVSENARSFDKRAAAKHRWDILRRVEQLPLAEAVPAFAAYALRGLKKHRRI